MRSAVIVIALSASACTCSSATAQQINLPTSQPTSDIALLLHDSPTMTLPDLPTSGGVRPLCIPAGDTLRYRAEGLPCDR